MMKLKATWPSTRGVMAFMMLALLGGCAGMPNPYSMPGSSNNVAAGSVDPRLSNSHSAQFFSKSGWQACAGGALTGILACQLGNPSDKGSCMAAAAVVGCGVGMGANYYLDTQRSKYANAEQRLDATIADVRKDNQELQSLTRTAQEVIAEDRSKIEQIKRDLAAKRLRNEEARQQIASIDANAAFLKKTLADTRAKEQEWRKVAAAERGSGAKVDSLEAEINAMQRQIASLEQEVDELYQQRSSIQLG